MGGLRSLFGGKSPVTTPDYTGLQVQTAVNTLPIPIIWGMARIAPNVIWYNNFRTISNQGGKNGGKGGSLFGSGTVSYTYTADLMMGICEGPITGINTVWKNQSIYTLAQLDLALFPGTTPQGVWNYLADTDPGQALAYQGTAYLAAAGYQLSSAATIDNHNLEIQGFRYGTGYGQTPYTTYLATIYDNVTFNGSTSTVNAVLPFNNIVPATGFFDADPALIIYDFLTAPQFGVDFPLASIDLTTLLSGGDINPGSLQTYCRAVGIALSPALTNQEQASAVLDRYLQLCNCAAVWSGGLLRFIPYGDSPVLGNGINFVPDATPIYDLDDDDYVTASGEGSNQNSGNDDPITVARSDFFGAYNVWRLEVADRANQYNLTTVEARDQNAIELVAITTGGNGMRIAPTVTAHEICDTGVALISAQLMVQRAVYIRNTFKFKLDWECCLLDPMDLVTVTDAVLGLSKFPVRIINIAEDENGIIEVTAEEFPQGAQTATLYATTNATGTSVNRNALAPSANAPLMFEPTDALGGGLQLWIALSGPTIYWGGANAFASFEENGNYDFIGAIDQGAVMGTLTAALPSFTENIAGPTLDNVNTLSVDLTESRGVLPTSTLAAALALINPCYVDGEIVAYANETLTAASAYNLTSLVRGADDTTVGSHPTGARFVLLNNAIFKYAYDASLIGQTIYLKFPSFNIFGVGLQSLADCVAYPYTLTGAALASPLPNIQNLRNVFNANIGFQQLVWDSVKDFRPFTYEVRSGSSYTSALTLSTDATDPFTVPGDGTYWVAARYALPSGALVYSETWQSVTIAGAVITQNVIKTINFKTLNWPGDFTGGAGVDSTLNGIRTGGGNILTDTNVLTTADVLDYGGGSSGTYYPAGAFLDIGYVTAASVVIAYQPTGLPVGQNILAVGDFLSMPDVLGSASTQFVDIYPQINTSSTPGGDLYALGDLYQAAYVDLYAASDAVWNGWQKFAPGTYQTRFLNFAMVLDTNDPNTIAECLEFIITITLPPRIDTYPLTTSASADTTVTFAPTGQSAAPFNGGAGAGNLPVINWGVVNAQQGDDLIITALSLSAISFNISNGGSRVVRNVTLTAEGF